MPFPINYEWKALYMWLFMQNFKMMVFLKETLDN